MTKQLLLGCELSYHEAFPIGQRRDESFPYETVSRGNKVSGDVKGFGWGRVWLWSPLVRRSKVLIIRVGDCTMCYISNYQVPFMHTEHRLCE